MMNLFGFVFPSDRRQRRGNLTSAGKSRTHRNHTPGITDDELDDLWELGRDTAGACVGFRKSRQKDPEQNCVYCGRLASCTGEIRDVPPDLFKLIKTAFRHDLIAH